MEKEKDKKTDDILEKLVHINRITKVVKGGRRFGFSALVVVGNQAGKIGIAHAKAKQVPDAIKKANEMARRKLIHIPLREGRTIHHDVKAKDGSGKIVINGKDVDKYFLRPVLNMLVNQPLELTNKKMNVDTTVTVSGGGMSGQAGAVRHGISKALTLLDPNLRPILKTEGLLTRDSRIVERKKYGRRKARRRFQFSKR